MLGNESQAKTTTVFVSRNPLRGSVDDSSVQSIRAVSSSEIMVLLPHLGWILLETKLLLEHWALQKENEILCAWAYVYWLHSQTNKQNRSIYLPLLKYLINTRALLAHPIQGSFPCVTRLPKEGTRKNTRKKNGPRERKRERHHRLEQSNCTIGNHLLNKTNRSRLIHPTSIIYFLCYFLK